PRCSRVHEIEVDRGRAGSPLLAAPVPSVIDQDLPHRPRRQGKEVGAVVADPRDLVAGQLEVGLVHDGRGRQRLDPPEAAALPRGDPLELRVDQLVDPREGAAVAPAGGGQQRREVDFGRRGHCNDSKPPRGRFGCPDDPPGPPVRRPRLTPRPTVDRWCAPQPGRVVHSRPATRAFAPLALPDSVDSLYSRRTPRSAVEDRQEGAGMESRGSRSFARMELVALALLVSTVAPLAATSIVPLSDEALVDLSPVILIGKVEGRLPPLDGARSTDWLVTVERPLKGDSIAGSVVVRTPGGRDGEEWMHVFGAPEFRRGERVLLFLRPIGDDRLAVVHVGQGAFHLARAGGRQWAARDQSEVQVLRRQPRRGGQGRLR